MGILINVPRDPGSQFYARLCLGDYMPSNWVPELFDFLDLLDYLNSSKFCAAWFHLLGSNVSTCKGADCQGNIMPRDHVLSKWLLKWESICQVTDCQVDHMPGKWLSMWTYAKMTICQNFSLEPPELCMHLPMEKHIFIFLGIKTPSWVIGLMQNGTFILFKLSNKIIKFNIVWILHFCG